MKNTQLVIAGERTQYYFCYCKGDGSWLQDYKRGVFGFSKCTAERITLAEAQYGNIASGAYKLIPVAQ